MPQIPRKDHPQTTNANIGVMGLPGELQHIIVINEFRDPHDPRNVGGPKGIPGKYKVIFVLDRPGFSLLPERKYSFSGALKGDSHLAITKPAFSPPGDSDADPITKIKIYGNTEDGNFEFIGLPNEKGFLGKIESEPFDANDLFDAERKAYRVLASSLSYWSVHLDIPLHVYQMESGELRTGNTQMTLLPPSWEAPFAVAPTAELRKEFRGYASLYREALNSNSPVYRYLCLFKIIEGIQSRRARLGTEARKSGVKFRRPPEVVPERAEEFKAWLNGIFPIRREWDAMSLDSIFHREALGKRFNYVIEKALRPLRVDIAHALASTSGELTLSADELLHRERVNKWLPITKCIVRRMLKNEFPDEFLSYLREDGTIAPENSG